MENTKLFLKNNWFKISLIVIAIILLLLISLAIFHFYNLYRSNLDREGKNYYQQQAEKCAELSLLYVSDLRQQEKDSNKQLGMDLTPSIEYHNHLNKKLNTCLVYTDTTYQSINNPQGITSTQEVRDLINDKSIIWNSSYNVFNSDGTINKGKSNNTGMTNDEFYNQKQKLMSE